MDTQETKIYVAFLIAAAVLGVIVIYFFINIIRQQKRHRHMQKEKIQAEIQTLEKERSRIAADLHDELGPLLSAVRFRINAVDVTSDEDQEMIDKANVHIDESINRLREIARNLVPETLLRKGVAPATEEFIRQVSKITAIKITFEYEALPLLSPEKNMNLYRIIQEVIHNTLKHAKAQNLFLQLTRKKDKVILTARDDGIGFDLNGSTAENKGLGLRNLLSRTEVMHGELIFESRPGMGVCYVFEIPVE